MPTFAEPEETQTRPTTCGRRGNFQWKGGARPSRHSCKDGLGRVAPFIGQGRVHHNPTILPWQSGYGTSPALLSSQSVLLGESTTALPGFRDPTEG